MHRLSIRRTLRKLLSPEFVHQVAHDSGAFVRLRRVDPFVLVWTLVLGSLSGRVRSLAELRQRFERVSGVTLQESSFYDRFTPALSAMLSTLLEHVLQHSWGAARRAKGSCTERACDPGQVCGGLRGLACPDGQYCNYAPDALCGAADATGTCADIPQACTREYAPVCGCDDQTYSNACTAASAGVSVVHRGECETNGGGTGFCEYHGQRYAVGDGFPSDDGCNTCTCTEGGQVACTLRACVDFCGGIAGFGCPDGQFCNYPPDAMCGAADQTGTCEPQPQACTLQYDPVCGCDGQTYGNACAAAAEGMSIVHEGEC